MRPTQCHDHSNNNVKRENIIPSGGMCPSPLKINKDSHVIKKSSSSATSSPTPPPPPPHRHPVIIYTHSPKVIHTHPKDFMALVQKLTGMSRSSSSSNNEDMDNQIKGENGNDEVIKNGKAVANDDTESSSVITSEENCGGGGGGGGSNNLRDGQVNSSTCYIQPPIYEPPNPYLTNNLPVFAPNSADLLCTNQPFFNYPPPDCFFFPPNIGGSVSSSSTPDGLNDYREF